MEPLIKDQRLGADAATLVSPLIGCLDNPRTVHFAIKSLGEIGPMANESIPAIQKAAQAAGKSLERVSTESIRKIRVSE
jgi:hypothetical protein